MTPTLEQLRRKHRVFRTLEIVMPIVGIIGGTVFLQYSNAHYRDMSWWTIAMHWIIGILYLVVFSE